MRQPFRQSSSRVYSLGHVRDKQDNPEEREAQADRVIKRANRPFLPRSERRNSNRNDRPPSSTERRKGNRVGNR
jgi:hypothetical protein